MTKKMTKKITILSKSEGFHKIQYENGHVEYVKSSKLKDLKKDYVLAESIEEKIENKPEASDNESNTETSNELDLGKLNKDDLVEIAKRLGYNGEITKEVTKAILIEFIEANKDK